ncbi:MAG: hypothetical protein JST21_14990 [Bacteroidetes bacterium]|nr:hypothetical protein [Bacteroidota bacterium]
MSTRISDAYTGNMKPATVYPNNPSSFLSIRNLLPKRQTAIQLVQLEKIKTCNDFTKAFAGSGFFDKSFPSTVQEGSNGLDRVTKILMNKALTGTFPDYQIDFSKVLISKGDLLLPQHATVSKMKGHRIYFSFTDNSNSGDTSSTDKVILVAYSKKLNQAIFSLDAGTRKDCEAVLKAPSLRGGEVETWIGFINEEETKVSNSVYTGCIIL